MAKLENSADLEKSISENELLRLEDRYLTKKSFYDETDLKIHRNHFTIDQRVAIVKCKAVNYWDNKIFPEDISESQRKFISEYNFEKDSPVVKRRKAVALTRLFQGEIRRELESILRGESSNYPEFRKINITKEAYDKANYIAKRMLNASRNPDEIYLYALRNRSKEDEESENYSIKKRKEKMARLLNQNKEITPKRNKEPYCIPLEFYKPEEFSIREGSKEIKITDFYIPPQRVTPVSCSIDLERHEGHKEKIKTQGKHVVGWSHSHANFSTFHSSIDKENLKHAEGTERVISIDFYGKPFRILVETVPSLVFNAKNSEPDLRIASRYTFSGSEKLGLNSKTYYVGIDKPNPRLRLNIIKEENSILSDVKKIDEEIYERVDTQFKPEFIKRFNPEKVDTLQKDISKPAIDTLEKIELVKDNLQKNADLEQRIGDLLESKNSSSDNQIYQLTRKEYSDILQRLQKYESQNKENLNRINSLESMLNKKFGWLESLKSKLFGFKDIISRGNKE